LTESSIKREGIGRETAVVFLSPERNDNVTTITATEASKRLDEVLDNLAESHEVVQIAGQRHSGVLVSEDDWRAIQETLYLTSVAGMKDSIVEGLRTPVEQCAKDLDW
jgi:PHD/YefM family antitoxin component YafN of YafNO toxin-antitoxin module